MSPTQPGVFDWLARDIPSTQLHPQCSHIQGAQAESGRRKRTAVDNITSEQNEVETEGSFWEVWNYRCYSNVSCIFGMSWAQASTNFSEGSISSDIKPSSHYAALHAAAEGGFDT